MRRPTTIWVACSCCRASGMRRPATSRQRWSSIRIWPRRVGTSRPRWVWRPDRISRTGNRKMARQRGCWKSAHVAAAFSNAGVPSPVRAIALLVAAILLAVGLAGASPASAQSTDVRTITIRAAPDGSYRAQPNWEGNLRTNVAAVSAAYEKTFRIRFVLLDIVPWAAGLRGDRVRQISKLMADVPPGRADLVVAFSGQCEGNKAGWTMLFYRYAVVTSGCGTPTANQATAQAILSHELAHLFGAFHPDGNVESVMRNGPADRFDDQTTRILRLTRDFDFSRGVTSLTPETRRAWSAIYAEGHASGEPNPLASAFARAGETLLHQAKPQEAEAALHEAIRLDATVALPYATLGSVYASTGRLEEAVRELRIAKALDARLMEARIVLGFALLELRRDEDALSEFQDALQMDPASGTSVYGSRRHADASRPGLAGR